MELRKIGNSNDYYTPEESRKVGIRRFIIAIIIVTIGGFLIWMKIKSL